MTACKWESGKLCSFSKPLNYHIICHSETSPVLSCPSMSLDTLSTTHTFGTEMPYEVKGFSPREFPGSQDHGHLCQRFERPGSIALLRRGCFSPGCLSTKYLCQWLDLGLGWPWPWPPGNSAGEKLRFHVFSGTQMCVLLLGGGEGRYILALAPSTSFWRHCFLHFQRDALQVKLRDEVKL